MKRNNRLEYKGYVGTVAFDGSGNIFHGEVVDLKDRVAFEGETVKDLRASFEKSVDKYLEACTQRGESPRKAFSGKFVVRIDPELHRALAGQARAEGKSLNGWVTDALRQAEAGRAPIPRLDKTSLTITALNDENEEDEYWRGRSPAERLQAIEINRRMVYGEKRTASRLQRFLEIAELPRS